MKSRDAPAAGRLHSPLENAVRKRSGRGRPGMSISQRGVGIFGFVVLLAVVGFVAVIGMRVFPTFVEYRAAVSAVKKAKASGTTVVEIQKAFDRSATIDDITAISGKDLDITKVNDDIVVSFAYTKKIPLFGPASLTIDYAGSSDAL